jgi:cyclohexyl-isocyanide hydratase
MTDEGRQQGMTVADRRRFLQAMAAVAGLAASPAMAQSPGIADPKPMAMHGVLGAASAGPGRPKIAMLVHPRMVMQDFIGPLTVFNLIHSEIHLVWKKHEPVMTEVGLPVMPSTPFADCPTGLDVLFVPGGLDGSIMMIDDQEVLEFLADRGKTARYVTSDCTGALVLGAAGLLLGYKATGHWYIRDLLSLLGATPVNERVVHDRNRITDGGVTARIDFGLTLVSLLRSREDAEWVQLVIEYAPAPPFNAGLPETAPKAVYERLMRTRFPAVSAAREKAARIGAKFMS